MMAFFVALHLGQISINVTKLVHRVIKEMVHKFHSTLFAYQRYQILFLFLVGLSPFAKILAQPANQNLDSLQATFTLTELLSQTEELNKKTNELILQLQDTVSLHALNKSISELSSAVNITKEESDIFQGASMREWMINNLLIKWNREKGKYEKLNNIISEVVQNSEKELANCRELKSVWIKSRAEVLKDNLGESLKKPITDLLINLRTEEKLLQQRIKDYLKLREQLSEINKEISTYIDLLTGLSKKDLLSYFNQDNEVLWKRKAVTDSISIQNQLRYSFSFFEGDTIDYIQINRGRVITALLAGILLLLIVYSVKKQFVKSEPNALILESLDRVQHYAGAYTFTATIIIALLILTDRPPVLTELLLLLFTFPLIVLVIARSSGIIRYLSVGFLILYWSLKVTNFLIINNQITVNIDLIHTLIATILLLLLNMNRKELRRQFPMIYEFIQHSVIPYLFILTSIALILQIVGFTLLSRALTFGSINFIYLAPVILISAGISRDLLRIVEQSMVVKNSALAQQFYPLLYAGIKLLAFYLLLLTLIKGFSLHPLVVNSLDLIWNFGGQFGQFHFTVGAVLEFFFILIVAGVISRILQVLLADEILSRLNMKRGVPMAIGVIVRYSIVALGFLLAVASTGFDLNKISILAGALGVGIGFGLQGLVANFIAGLILIFERPFVVNDTIESDLVEGHVKQIGMRASKILTYDGAEVIIPNSNLIGNRVTNWTMSDSSRRQMILIRTSMQANPDDVIDILNRITREHENILVDPAPFVVFEGQIEQTLQFKLYYWLVSDMFKTRSELNLAIYRELKTLGVELPVRIYSLQTQKDN